MRRLQLALLLCAAVTGCGGKADDDDPIVVSKPKKASGGPVASGPKLTPVKGTSYDGVIKGKVTWGGDKPDLEGMTKQFQDSINATRDYCLKGKEVEITQQAYRIGANGGLGNVFVWIEPAEADKYFEVPDAQLTAFKTQEVAIRQPHCAFMPHCTVVFPFHYKDGVRTATGQKLRVDNDAEVPHNAKIAGTDNPESNEQLAVGKSAYRLLRPEGDVVQISCGVHPWMRGYIRAFSHPYAAITRVGADLEKKVYEDKAAKDFGEYEIKNVPVGAKVKLKVWHEALGFLTKPEGEEITIAKEQTKDFTAQKK
ncbi:MAG: hypothetical protein ACRC33_31270 [Gemmataceae bacterium]